jgi:hypothetical protein
MGARILSESAQNAPYNDRWISMTELKASFLVPHQLARHHAGISFASHEMDSFILDNIIAPALTGTIVNSWFAHNASTGNLDSWMGLGFMG